MEINGVTHRDAVPFAATVHYSVFQLIVFEPHSQQQQQQLFLME